MMNEEIFEEALQVYEVIACGLNDHQAHPGAKVDGVLMVISSICESVGDNDFDDAVIERLRAVADVLENGESSEGESLQ